MSIPITEEQLVAAAERLGIVVGSAADNLLRAAIHAVAVAMEEPEQPPVPIACPWLYDAPVSREPDRLFPQVGFSVTGAAPTPEQTALYGYTSAKPPRYADLAKAQEINPTLNVLRIFCQQEYQGWTEKPGKFGNGKPFDETGPASVDGKVFAGHWLYKPRTTLISALSATGVTVQVADPSLLSVGGYACVYNSGEFFDAEHVKVVSIQGDLITLERGYKSLALDHSADSYIAQHQLGNGGDPRNWAYNLSTECPLDTNGNSISEVLACWIAEHYQQDQHGAPAPLRIDGVLYDSDFFDFAHGGARAERNCSVRNNNVPDWGRLPDGRNAWGIGLEAFYAHVRELLPDAILVCGDSHTFGIPNNGAQLEAFANGDYAVGGDGELDYKKLATYLSSAKTQMVIGRTPRLVEALNKHGADNEASSRLSFCLAQMFDCIASRKTGDVAHRWADEYAVLNGKATDDPAGKHWMGAAIGRYQRVFNESLFAEDMQISPTTILSPGDYTVCWDSAYAEPSIVTVTLGGAASPPLFVAPGPNRNVCVVRVTRAVAASPRIEPAPVGPSRVFAGNADVFRRDFEYAAVFANATSEPVSITIDPPMRLIDGDDPVNDGSLISWLELAPYDGRVLCR